ncbi:ABC-type multidrug transport system fused ATPase/permease subunit [Catenuloplanes nepalensis]|uniref:ABC-type multidrug transport system fused ATPase/permease subunit n=1 Tax=Catenuloplanes nepalensis TaxID=587533 RepID=A0ABT9MPG7_9ACTN|nr:ABC transporter ATP-binding protein [Catenuloplanes nepalensis]MDP9793315.1 ABC-type multidrug transport system fused ATPase/permease subunit [Catenuloplanes nepalensis]
MDTRGPWRYLWWLARRLKRRVALGAFFGSAWFLSLAVTPWLIAQAIDRGLAPRRPAALAAWAAVLLAVGVLSAGLGIMRHRSMTRMRLAAALETAESVLRHATRLGAALPRRITAGEVVTIGISDVWTIGRALNVGGVGVASLVACLAVALLLWDISPLLAVVVLAGVPVLALLIVPLLARTRDAGTRYRERQGALNTRLTDIVGGLRILNGLGGKDTHQRRYELQSTLLRDQGYRVGVPSSWIGALGGGLPIVFLAVVIWLAARLAVAGDLTPGQLVAVYGYTAMLVIPVDVLILCGRDLAHGVVAARRVVTFLGVPVEDPAGVPGPGGPATLYDPESGVSAAPGRLTALAGSRPADAREIIDRLGRYAPSEATWDGTPLSGIDRDEIRRRILVADNDAALFAGPLRDVVAGRHDGDVRPALDTAVAHDVGDDLDRPVDWGGRNLSGGQRQRVRLARAIHADPEMLLAVEPTSAVDAHTEAAIAERLSTARDGRGTVLATTSPVLLDRADIVFYLVDGRVAATGTHRALLAESAGYRALVTRAFGEDS